VTRKGNPLRSKSESERTDQPNTSYFSCSGGITNSISYGYIRTNSLRENVAFMLGR
jgi:hypothetical protein